MLRQTIQQATLAKIQTVRDDTIWGWYYNFLVEIIGDTFYDFFESTDSTGDSDSDMETELSSDTFAAFSDPVSDDSMNSEDTYHLIINQCLQILDAAEEEVH